MEADIAVVERTVANVVLSLDSEQRAGATDDYCTTMTTSEAAAVLPSPLELCIDSEAKRRRPAMLWSSRNLGTADDCYSPPAPPKREPSRKKPAAVDVTSVDAAAAVADGVVAADAAADLQEAAAVAE